MQIWCQAWEGILHVSALCKIDLIFVTKVKVKNRNRFFQEIKKVLKVILDLVSAVVQLGSFASGLISFSMFQVAFHKLIESTQNWIIKRFTSASSLVFQFSI